MSTTTEPIMFINSGQLAARLGVSGMTITRMRRAGRLPLAAYADGSCTLWTVESIDRWEAAGRPIDVPIANDAGTDACHRADISAFEDQRRGPLPDAPELRRAIADMRRAADVCERILNLSGNFQKPAVNLPAVDRCRLTSDDAGDADTL